jgi:hypothetical protein
MTYQPNAHTFSATVTDAEYLQVFRDMFAEDFPNEQQPYQDDQRLYAFLVRMQAKQNRLMYGNPLANR